MNEEQLKGLIEAKQALEKWLEKFNAEVKEIIQQMDKKIKREEKTHLIIPLSVWDEQKRQLKNAHETFTLDFLENIEIMHAQKIRL